MHVICRPQGTTRVRSAALSLARQSFDVRFNGSNPDLHGIALTRHAVKPTRSNRYWLAFNLDLVVEEAGFVLVDGEHNTVAADAAPEGTASCAIGHSESSMNGRVHCTPSRSRGKDASLGPDHPATGTWLSSAVVPPDALDQRLDGNSLSVLESGSARPERRRVNFDRRAVVDVHGQQSPFPRPASPDVGCVGVPGSSYRQRDAMKRLWCLICCHIHHCIYSPPESASRNQAPQVQRDEPFRMEILQ